MNLMGLFRSPQNELEKGGKPVPEEDAGIRTTCPHCGVQLPLNDLQDNLQAVSYTHLFPQCSPQRAARM